MAQYTIKTTLLGESNFGKIRNSLKYSFSNSQLQSRGNDLTIRIDLPEIQSLRRDATAILDEYFDDKYRAGIIGNWTVEKE